MPFTLQPQGQIVRQRRRGLRRLRSRGKGCFNVAREEDRGSRRSCCCSARLGKFGSKDLLVELLWVKVLPSLYTSWDISPRRCRSSLSGNATVNLSFPNFVTICRDNLNLIYMHNQSVPEQAQIRVLIKNGHNLDNLYIGHAHEVVYPLRVQVALRLSELCPLSSAQFIFNGHPDFSPFRHQLIMYINEEA